MGFRRVSALLSAAFVSNAIAASASTVKCGKGHTPQQVHFNYNGPTGLIVSWNTEKHLERPTVKYGEHDSFAHEASSDISVTYETSTTYNNHVFIDGLKPNTEYGYVVSCEDTVGHKKFKTSREAGDNSSFSFAFIADMGTFGPLGLSDDSAGTPLVPGEQTTIQSLKGDKEHFEFLWQDGDLAYADAWLKEEIAGYLPNTTIAGGAAVYESILNAFYDELTNVTAERPFMVGPGNHEANCDNGGTTDSATGVTYNVSICMEGQRNFTGYINHFRMPSEVSGGVGNFWYSWDYGMVHFVQINTETDFPNAPDLPGGSADEDAGPFAPNGTQLAWLRADLAAVDRKKTPWVIVAGHRPWYVAIDTDLCEPCQEAFEPIFIEHKVDVVLAGHTHVYERNSPVAYNVTDPAGLDNPTAPWYIVNGAAGHYDGLDTFTGTTPSYFEVGFDTVYGWSHWTVHNCTHLTQEFIASGNGSVLDTATLYKDRKC